MNKVFPNHIAIIPDGNRRWARERGLPSFEGHRRGFDVAVKISRYIRSLGIHTLTIWAFSTENWRRTPEEVGYLMRLYARMVDKYLKEAIKDGVRIVHLGRKDRIPDYLQKKIADAQTKTKNNNKYILNIALDYGGRDEILRAIDKINEKKAKVKDVTEQELARHLDTALQPYPNPDIIIRTSGEQRTSGFLIWQASYAELFFVKKYFPDFTEQAIDLVLDEYSKRQRQFGK